MYKWFLLKNYKPYWNNLSISIPYLHIEDIVKKSDSYIWEEIPNAAIEWKYPMEQALLQTNNVDRPTYLKCSDGKQNFYFYFETITNTTSEYNKEFYYDCVYTLDKYMTYFFNKFHILMNNQQEVNFLRRFSDRLNYTTNDQGELQSITFDLLKNKQFGNTLPVNDNQMIRKYIYGTSENELWKDNFFDIEIPTNVIFKNWSNTDTTTIPWSKFTTANERKRYGYIVAKSSALQSSKSTQDKSFVSHAKNTKIIIPLFNDQNSEYINNVFRGLLNFDITHQQDNLVNALSNDNFIGYFECDVPYSLWYGESVINKQIELKYGNNYIKDNDLPLIAFFEVPANFAPKWTIIDFKSYDKGFDGKIKYLIKNYNVWNSDTEPTLLNPAYYQERCFLDNGKFISTDTSLIKYDLDQIESIDELGLSLKAYFMFDADLHIAYDYEKYNNTLNPIWNNKYSNIRSNLGTPNGVYGSGSANYYTNNANTLTTGLDTLKTQQQIDWVNYGNKQVNTLTNIASGLFNPFKLPSMLGKMFKGVSNGIFGGATLALEHMNENKKLASQIHNIQSSANILLSNPYVDASITNKEINGNTLFNTYSNELHPWSKEIMFKYLLANGYPFNKVDKINTFYNRQYMNVIQVDTTYNYDILIQTLNTYDNTIYGSLSYHLEFLAWLSNLHRFYNTIDIVNVLEPNRKDYISNIEIKQPIIPSSRIDINTLIVNRDIKYSTYVRIWEHIEKLNPNLPIDLYEDLIIDQQENSIIITTKPESAKYYGSMVIVCKKLPDKFNLAKYLNNKVFNIITSQNSSETNNANFYVVPHNTIYEFTNLDIPLEALLENYKAYSYKINVKTTDNNQEQIVSGDHILDNHSITLKAILPNHVSADHIAPVGCAVTFWGTVDSYGIAYGANYNLNNDKTLQNVFNLTTNTISLYLDLENNRYQITLTDWWGFAQLPNSVNLKHFTNQFNVNYYSFVAETIELELFNY